jgi:hypothetical protein
MQHDANPVFRHPTFESVRRFLASSLGLAVAQIKRAMVPLYEELYPDKNSRWRLNRLASDLALLELPTHEVKCTPGMLPRLVERIRPRQTPAHRAGIPSEPLLKWKIPRVLAPQVGDTPLRRYLAGDTALSRQLFRTLIDENTDRLGRPVLGSNPDESDESVESDNFLPGALLSLSLWNSRVEPLGLYSTLTNFNRFIESVSAADFVPFVKRHVALSEFWLRAVERGPSDQADELFSFPVEAASGYRFVRRSDDPSRRSSQLWLLLEDDTPEGLLYLCEQAHRQGEDFEIW